MEAKFSQLFASVLKRYDGIITGIESFINHVSRAIISHNITEYEEDMKLLSDCKKLISEPVIGIDPYLDLSYTKLMYDKFATLDNNIETLLELFKNKLYINYRNSNISVTNALIEESDRQLLIKQFQQIKEDNLKNDSAIFSEILKYSSFKNVGGVQNTLVLFIKKNKSINRLTIFLMKEALKTASKPNLDMLRSMIEEYKSKSIGASRITSTNPGSNKNTTNLLSRNNMFPMRIFQEGDIPLIIKGITDSGKVNLMVVNISAQHELDYNSSLLYGDTPRTSGINAKFIKDTLTVIDLGSSKENKTSWEEHNTGDDSKPWLTMEVMAGKYRFLTNIIGDTSKKHLFNNAIPRENGLNGKPWAYNTQTYVDLLDSSAKYIKEKYSKRPEIKESTEPKKQKIFDGIIGIMPIPKSIRDFRYIRLPAEDVMRIFESAFTKPVVLELYYGFYIKLYNIVSEFTKRLRKEFHTTKINEKVFTEYDKSAIDEYFKKEITRIVSNILDTMDNLRLFSQFTTSLKEVFIQEKDI